MEEQLKKLHKEIETEPEEIETEPEETDVLFKRLKRGDFGRIESKNAKLIVGKKYEEYINKIKDEKNKRGKKKNEK